MRANLALTKQYKATCRYIQNDYFDDKLPSKSSKMAAKVRVILKRGFNSYLDINVILGKEQSELADLA